jgi:hypothetical protein
LWLALHVGEAGETLKDGADVLISRPGLGPGEGDGEALLHVAVRSLLDEQEVVVVAKTLVSSRTPFRV